MWMGCILRLAVKMLLNYMVLGTGDENISFIKGSFNYCDHIYRVICLNCDALYDRDYIQQKLMEKHSFNIQETVNMIRPDGDVEIPLVRVI